MYRNMSIKRITITMDEMMQKNVLNLQANFITQTGKNWNFSSTTSFLVNEGIKSLSKFKKNVKNYDFSTNN